ncbi:hypothetical protein [Nocardia sp. NBC_00511]|uniref:hypothetical protein n=1 Tax=Nocardia sp. NBC_00511 TaxID=2903591 RepID=UPI0030E3FDD5
MELSDRGVPNDAVHGMDNFGSMTKQVVAAGINTARTHNDAIIAPFARYLGLLDLTGIELMARLTPPTDELP